MLKEDNIIISPKRLARTAVTSIGGTDDHQGNHGLKKTAAASSPKRLAKIAGVLYLLVGVFGGFAEGFVDPKVFVAGNAAATFGNVVANSGLVRLGVVAHLLDGTFFVFLALTLYSLLQHVHKGMARAMLVLVALATGIILSQCGLPV